MANRLLLSHVVGESLIHVINPVADQAVHYIVDKLGYTDLFKDNIDIRTDARYWTKSNDKDNVGKLRPCRVRVKLNPNVEPSTIKWEASGTTIDLGNGNTLIQNNGGRHAQRTPWADGMHYSKSKFSIMRDDEIAVDLTDHTVGTSISMEVTFEFSDEHQANEALSRIMQVFTNGDKINYIDIAYDVPVPESIQNVLRYIYHLKTLNANNPDGAFITNADGKKVFNVKGWYNWLQERSNKVVTHNFNRNRPEHKELIINKNHFQALYLIECNQETPTPLDPEGNAVTLNLVVQFARSDRILLEYPVIINNNYVDPKFVPMERKVRAAGPESMIMWDNPAVTHEWIKTYIRPWPPKPFMFPYWDPWMVPIDSRAWLSNYRPVLVAAFTLDDPETKFDFDTDVGNVFGCKLDDEIIKCIHEKKNKVFGVDEFVNITVYADDVMTDPRFLDISDGHTLIIKNRRKVPVYRMVISIGPKIKETAHNWNRVWVVNIITKKVGFNKPRKD